MTLVLNPEEPRAAGNTLVILIGYQLLLGLYRI